MTTPAAGGRRSSNPPLAQGSRRTSCRPTAARSPSSSTWPRRTAGSARGAGAAGRRAAGELQHRRPGPARLPDDPAARAQPGLVVLSISGFGHDGPEAGRAGYDQIAQGEAGLMSLTGSSPDEPMRVGLPVADLLAGMYGAYGVLAALLERSRTGRGQLVRSSLLSAVVGIHAYQGTRWTVAGEVACGAREPPPVDLAVRPLPLPRRRRADLGRQRGAVAAPLRRLRPRPDDARHGDQRRAGGPSRRGDRAHRGGLRDVGRRAAARPAGRGQRAGRPGPPAGPGLRVGADPQPGPAGGRRPRHPGPDHPARPTPALLRPDGTETDPDLAPRTTDPRRRRRGHPHLARLRARTEADAGTSPRAP